MVLLSAACLCLAAGCRGGAGPATQARPAVVTTKSGAEMILVPGGAFEMGGADGSAGESPARHVLVSSFLMDRHEVTQRQYAEAQIPDPSHFKNPENPVDQANWTDAARFCNERSCAEGLNPCYDEKEWSCNFEADGYRLPTEAEWEFACRAGASTTYHFGDDPRALGAYAWFESNSESRTHAVAQKLPNPWGLFDMHGNVAEWCNDLFDPSYGKAGPDRDPRGPSAGGPERAVRGGSWKSSARGCRAANRFGDRSVLDTCLASDTLGFRCVRRATPQAAAPPQRSSGDGERAPGSRRAP